MLSPSGRSRLSSCRSKLYPYVDDVVPLPITTGGSYEAIRFHRRVLHPVRWLLWWRERDEVAIAVEREVDELPIRQRLPCGPPHCVSLEERLLGQRIGHAQKVPMLDGTGGACLDSKVDTNRLDSLGESLWSVRIHSALHVAMGQEQRGR